MQELIYISCDHPIFSRVSLFDFLEEFGKRGGKIAFINEVHKALDLQSHSKSACDFLDLKIVFSGSSVLQITNPDFTRRFSMFKLPIFSLREFIALELNIFFDKYSLEEILKNHQEIAIEIIKKLNGEKILKILNDYLDHGSYPFYFEDKINFKDRLSDTINTSLYEDLRKYSIFRQKKY